MPIYLQNGFVYDYDRTSNHSKRMIIGSDKTNNISSDVKKIMWQKDIIYGYRTGHAGEIYYFICKYGENCSDSQHYNDVQFNILLKQKSLPEFSYQDAKSYDELLSEQSKTSVGKKGG